MQINKMDSRQKNILSVAALLLTALLWGISYSAQAEAMNFLPPLFFVSLRYFIGSFLLLFPVLYRRHKAERKSVFNKKVLFSGIAGGFFLAGGEILQQYGLLYTSAGKAGFLTALYVIMIPVIEILLGKRSSLKIWSAALLSVCGTYLLCFNGEFNSITGNLGDVLILICALFFAFQFIVIGKYAQEVDALEFAGIQFFTVAVISGIAALLSGESCSVQQILKCSVPLWFCGGIAIGFACTVQVAAQKVVHPATASIILSMASVFAVLWGWLLRDEVYTPANLTGCAIIFAAVVMVELPERITKN